MIGRVQTRDAKGVKSSRNDHTALRPRGNAARTRESRDGQERRGEVEAECRVQSADPMRDAREEQRQRQQQQRAVKGTGGDAGLVIVLDKEAGGNWPSINSINFSPAVSVSTRRSLIAV